MRLSKKRAQELLEAVLKLYPNAQPTLNTASPFQILVAVLLSAQTTDVSVNAATPKLFAAFSTPEALAKAAPEEIEPYIDKLGLYHNKARYLHALGVKLVKDFNGEVPSDEKALISLPGVGRKTATVVRTDAFNIPGIAVDTHVSRIIRGFGIAPANATPDQIQQILQNLMPKSTWINLHRALIRLGREYLTARDPHFPKGSVWASFQADYQPVATKPKRRVKAEERKS